MGSTFIALPLSSGESFLLRTQDDDGREWTILVDSGKKYGEGRRELAKILAQVSPRIDRIDIAICTHSDSDHSNGFWFFADDWYDMGRSIGEFWLPGRWANAMPAILTDPAGLAAKLAQGAFEASALMLTEKNREILASKSREQRFNTLAKLAIDVEDGIFSAVSLPNDNIGDEDGLLAESFGLSLDDLSILRADLDETDDAINPFEKAASQVGSGFPWAFSSMTSDLPEMTWAKFNLVEKEGLAAFSEVAETADAIRKIAVSALTRKIRIRWFDFGEYEKTNKPSGGNAGLLEPFCSVEVVPDPSKFRRMSAFRLFSNLRLSKQNVESLVFYRPETKTTPGLLFLGDSRLAHGIERPDRNFPVPFTKPTHKLLVTAPHHGSGNNDRAFEVVNSWLGKAGAAFVRNGGQSNQTLGEYLSQKDRRCAQCVQCHGKDWNQWVAVSTIGNSWNWPPSANVCGKPKI